MFIVKNLLILISLLFLSSCAQHIYEGPKKPKSEIAGVRNHEGFVLVLAVDDKSPPKKLFDEHIFNAYMEPAVHKFTIMHTYTIHLPVYGLGTVGVTSSNNKIEDICFELMAGERYFITSKNEEAVIERTIFLGEFEIIPPLPCDEFSWD